MEKMKIWNGQEIPALGMGCWAIGGTWDIDAQSNPAGWGQTDDAQSLRALVVAADHGIQLFDTAQAYGTGHSESLVGQAFGNRDDVVIVTKIGLAIDADKRQLLGEETDVARLRASIDGSLARLQRDQIDLVFLHINELAVDVAEGVFDMLDDVRKAGKIGAYGWSTDFVDRVEPFAGREGFVAVEHAMNVFMPASDMVKCVEDFGLTGLIRSPLAMGLLSGRYGTDHKFSTDDIRSSNRAGLLYFQDGKVNPETYQKLESVRDVLQVDGRSLIQGALGWLWSASDRSLPIPGFRSVEQVAELCGALEFGPLPDDAMAEIARVMVE